ncbi:hypothetical protein FOVSG1_000181 [Fusarium oxysporum f. sp. vasinfectum]
MRAGEGKTGFKLMRAIKGKRVLSAMDMKTGGETCRGRGVLGGSYRMQRQRYLPFVDVNCWTLEMKPGTEENGTMSPESGTTPPEYPQVEEMLAEFLNVVHRVGRLLA